MLFTWASFLTEGRPIGPVAVPWAEVVELNPPEAIAGGEECRELEPLLRADAFCIQRLLVLWQPVAGWIADRAGRRVTMVAGMAFSLPILALMMQIPSEGWFLGFSALLGVGAATMWPAFMAHVGETGPPRSRPP